MRFFIIGVLACLLWRCSDDRLQKLEDENAALREETQYKDSMLTAFVYTFNKVSDNLTSIHQTKDSIDAALKAGKLTNEGKATVLSQIDEINRLMDENRVMIDSLQGKFNIENLNIGDLGRIVSSLNKQVNVRNREINELKYELANNDAAFSSLDYHLELLSEVNNEQAETILKQEKLLNTAWYIFGDYRSLRSKGIITKEKGFIKLRKAKKLGGDFNKDLFTEIDIRETMSFDIKGHRPRLLTPHPEGSYAISEKDSKIHFEIKDVEDFWSATKYLVVVLD